MCLVVQGIVNFFKWISSRPSLHHHLRKRGIKIVYWVCNSDDDYEQAFTKWGADCVMTDFPSRLREYLKTKGMLRRETGEIREHRFDRLNGENDKEKEEQALAKEPQPLAKERQTLEQRYAGEERKSNE